MEQLKCAIGFLTVIPVKSNVSTDKDFRDMLRFFPVVGLLLSIIYYLVTSIVFKFTDSIFFSSICYVVLSIVMTGGLHYDGLADSIDGLFSGREKDKMLEIMSDSRIGTFGVLAIVVNVLLKLGVVSLFMQYGLIYFAMLSVIFSRTMQVMYARNSKYAKQEGMGNFFIGKVSGDVIRTVLISSMLISLILCAFTKGYTYHFSMSLYFVSFALSVVIMMSMKKSIENKLDGITGDILGLVAEVGENLFLLVMFAVYNLM